MTTCLDMIKRGMRLAGALGEGEDPTDQEAEDGRTVMNSMLDSWGIERMFVPYIVEETIALGTISATYTMGPSGDLNTTRPTRIDDSCFIRYLGVDTPLPVINGDAYAAIIAKSIQSNMPMWLFPDMQYPLVTLYFYPVPTTATAIAHIRSWKQLQSFDTLTEVLVLPPGYQRAIEYSFAEEYGPEFGLDTPPMVIAKAAKARANVKRINAPAPVMRTEVGVMTGTYPQRGNIYTG